MGVFSYGGASSAGIRRTLTGTPGEIAVTNPIGAAGDPTVNLASGPKLLFRLTGADMTLTTDQAFTKIGSFTKYAVSEVVTRWTSGAFNTACLGGVYSAAAKGGDAMVAATQSYAALTGTGKIVKDTLAALLGTSWETATPILALTTGNGAALSADCFIFGYVLD